MSIPARGGAPGSNASGPLRGAVTFLCGLAKKSNSPKAKAFDVKDKAKSLDLRLRGDDKLEAFASPEIDELEATSMDPRLRGDDEQKRNVQLVTRRRRKRST